MKQKGFTLIELLVVISIIGLLSSVVLASLNTARKKARDAQRLSDMRQIQIALEFYYDKYGTYPTAASDVAPYYDGGFDGTADGNFLPVLVSEGFLSNKILDPLKSTAVGSGYRYYFYNVNYSTSYGCPRPFYVLRISDMESTSGRHPSSPGFLCGTYNLNSVEWATGKLVP